jgi:hypothetical protein
MALIGNLDAKSKYNSYRENIKNAYFKIESVAIDTLKEKARVQVRGWLSEYARHNQGIGIFKRVFYIPLEEFKGIKCTKDGLLKKSYEYISALPEFTDSKAHTIQYKGKIEITRDDADKQEDELQDLINSLKD